MNALQPDVSRISIKAVVEEVTASEIFRLDVEVTNAMSQPVYSGRRFPVRLGYQRIQSTMQKNGRVRRRAQRRVPLRTGKCHYYVENGGYCPEQTRKIYSAAICPISNAEKVTSKPKPACITRLQTKQTK